MIEGGYPHNKHAEKITVSAQLAEQEYTMMFTPINAYPARPGRQGMMLVGVQPPLPDRIASKNGLFYADEEINPGKSFTLRLGSTGIQETFRATAVSSPEAA
jgi:hypothetical protein